MKIKGIKGVKVMGKKERKRKTMGSNLALHIIYSSLAIKRAQRLLSFIEAQRTLATFAAHKIQ
jgi:hypothetical protein